jgi:hypothetical protein
MVGAEPLIKDFDDLDHAPFEMESTNQSRPQCARFESAGLS